MSTPASNVVPATFAADGLGTLSFVASSDECFGQIRTGGQLVAIKGSYSPVRVIAESERFVLTLSPIARPASNGPRLRGQLLDRDSGEVLDVVAWAPTKGGKAYGLSAETRAPTETHLPF